MLQSLVHEGMNDAPNTQSGRWGTPPPRKKWQPTTPPPLRPSKAKRGLAAVSDAVEQGNEDLVVFRLGTEVNVRMGSDPVRQAVACGHLGALEFLLRMGYPADAVGSQARPLALAIDSGIRSAEDVPYKMAELLLRYGCNPDEDDAGSAASSRCCLAQIVIAAQQKNNLVLRLLLSHRSDPNQCNELGQSPLHLVCQGTCQPLQPLPLSFGFHDLEADYAQLLNLPLLSNFTWEMPPASNSGWSPANAASRLFPPGPILLEDPLQLPKESHGKAEECVELLLSHGADPCARDATGRKPVDCLPSSATQLRAKLCRAESWYQRRNFRLGCRLLSDSSTTRAQLESESCVLTCLHLAESITGFL